MYNSIITERGTHMKIRNVMQLTFVFIVLLSVFPFSTARSATDQYDVVKKNGVLRVGLSARLRTL